MIGKEVKNMENMLRTQQIQVKKGHPLYDYFEKKTENEKNLENATNFVIRQIYTAIKTEGELHKLQQEMMDLIEKTMPQMNEIRHKTYEKEVENAIKKGKDATKVKPKYVEMPTATSWINYGILELFMKCSKNPDYLSLPIQSSQHAIKTVVERWKGFFEALKSYKENPSKFTGRPQIPGYAKTTKKTIKFTNQDAVIKENKFLKFPKTKLRLNVGKLGFLKYGQKLNEVRCKPYIDMYIVELVFDFGEKVIENKKEDVIMAVDFGVNNFMTCVFSDGSKPIIFNGRHLKSINQYYNKEVARLTSILREGKQENEGQFTSKRLNNLHLTRKNKMHDAFHKMSRKLIEIAEEYGVTTIVFGKNIGWKQEVQMQKKTKQHFVQIAHAKFVDYVKYKAEEKGITIKTNEESYTSKASSVDKDEIPTYGDEHIPNFSGRRIKRGLYRSANGTIINADVNGAYNILRKAVPRFFEGIEVAVSQPLKIKIV